MAATLARLLNPIVWRVPGHAARKLFSFSLAEHGSMLDLASAAHNAPTAARRTLYMRHMLDEARHAQMFALRSSELRAEAGQQSLGFPVADNEDLFVTLGEVRFLAFVHRGESRGRKQFETYRDWFEKQGDRKSRALFNAIIKDERRHESYTYDLLVELAGGTAAAKAEIRAAGLWEKWRIWRRAGRFLADKLYFAAMLLVYLASGPFMLLTGLGRRRPSGWIEHEAARPDAAARPPLSAPATAPRLEWNEA